MLRRDGCRRTRWLPEPGQFSSSKRAPERGEGPPALGGALDGSPSGVGESWNGSGRGCHRRKRPGPGTAPGLGSRDAAPRARRLAAAKRSGSPRLRPGGPRLAAGGRRPTEWLRACAPDGDRSPYRGTRRGVARPKAPPSADAAASAKRDPEPRREIGPIGRGWCRAPTIRRKARTGVAQRPDHHVLLHQQFGELVLAVVAEEREEHRFLED